MGYYQTPSKTYRLFEMIPGSVTWATFLAAVLLSWLKPLYAIYFIILFDLYWLFRVLYFVFYLTVSWRRYQTAVQINWRAKLEQDCPDWQKIYHLIFLPTAREEWSVIETTLTSLQKVDYPLGKFIVVLSGEGKYAEHFQKIAARAKEKFGSTFFRFYTTVHPPDLSDEIAGKGSNLNYAGHLMQKEINALQIPYDNIIVSAFDIDTCTHFQYFACLTHTYATSLKPTRTSYQPVALYNNNIWSSNPVMRVAAFGTTFWLLSELSRPERLFTFSSHSMSWRALVDVGFWQKDIVTEDSRIFLQCFLHYHGDYTVTPIYLPVSMDTVQANTLWRSLVNLYKQQRRWAWGVEHFPYMLWHFRHDALIPWRKKFKYLWNLGEGMYSWATAPILIFILGRLPMWLAPFEFRASVFAQTTPLVLEWLLRFAMAGILLSVILSVRLLPPWPQRFRVVHLTVMIAQWFLLPVTLILFGAIPAIDAQTRLLIGRYLGFWVTEKKRVVS